MSSIGNNFKQLNILSYGIKLNQFFKFQSDCSTESVVESCPSQNSVLIGGESCVANNNSTPNLQCRFQEIHNSNPSVPNQQTPEVPFFKNTIFPSQSRTSNKLRKRKRKRPLIKLDLTSTDETDSTDSGDEYYAFGRFVASKIRKLKNKTARRDMQHYILNLLYEAEFGKYKNILEK